MLRLSLRVRPAVLSFFGTRRVVGFIGFLALGMLAAMPVAARKSHLVKLLTDMTGLPESTYKEAVRIGGWTYFVGESESIGQALWRTDGGGRAARSWCATSTRPATPATCTSGASTG